MLAQASSYFALVCCECTERHRENTSTIYYWRTFEEWECRHFATCTALTYNVQRDTFGIVSIRLTGSLKIANGWKEEKEIIERKIRQQSKSGVTGLKRDLHLCGVCICEWNSSNQCFKLFKAFSDFHCPLNDQKYQGLIYLEHSATHIHKSKERYQSPDVARS